MYGILATIFLVGSAFAQTSTPKPLLDLVATANTSSFLSTLVDLIDTAGLTDTLEHQGPYTLFAPDNRAFAALDPAALAKLKANPTALADLLKYHVVSGVYNTSQLLANEQMLPSLAGTPIRVNDYMLKRRITLEGSYVTYPNKLASNGIIHRVHSVMFPPKGSLTDIAGQDQNLTIFMKAVQAAGIGAVLNEGPYTVLAPTNDAFNALGADKLAKLLANPTLLAEILKYHVIPGTLYTAGMNSGNLYNLEEKDQERIYTSFLGTYVYIDGHRISRGGRDISATNGVIHKISTVLIPRHQAAAFKAL